MSNKHLGLFFSQFLSKGFTKCLLKEIFQKDSWVWLLKVQVKYVVVFLIKGVSRKSKIYPDFDCIFFKEVFKQPPKRLWNQSIKEVSLHDIYSSPCANPNTEPHTRAAWSFKSSNLNKVTLFYQNSWISSFVRVQLGVSHVGVSWGHLL